MKSNLTTNNKPDASVNHSSGLRKSSTNNGFKSLLLSGTFIMMFLLAMTSNFSYGQYSISAGNTYSQNFDSLPQSGNWTMPAFWRIAGDGGVPSEGASGGWVDITRSQERR